jgi:hypothetical protein
MIVEADVESTPGERVAEQAGGDESAGSSALRVITWIGVGVAVAAAGIFVVRELRGRYKFNRRTPYDFYANADEQPGEFGLGV